MSRNTRIKTFSLPVFLILTSSLWAQSLVMVSGNGQVVTEQFLTNAPLVVQAKDAAGRPVPGVSVTWAITQGTGTINPVSRTTDNNGQASANFLATTLQPGLSVSAATVTASSALGAVSFVVTTSGGGVGSPPPLVTLIKPVAGSTLTVMQGSTLPGAVSVNVGLQSGVQAGQPVPNVGVRIVNAQDPTAPSPAVCNGPGGLVLTDATGTAICDLIATGAPGPTQVYALVGEYHFTPQFIVQITPGASCTFALSAASQLFGPSGGTGSVNVIAAPGCGWTAVSNAGFATITAGATGLGNGTVSYSVTGTSASRSGTLTIAGQTYTINQNAGTPGGLAITSPANLAGGTVGAAYSAMLGATGGQPPYSWSISGALPPGLNLAASTGVISGTPSASGNYGFSATVRDNAGAIQSQNFTIAIQGGGSSSLTITNAGFPNGVVGQAYSQLLTSSGGCVTPFSPGPSFQVSAGSLPGGLSIVSNSDASRSIAGTPTANGTFNFTLTASDACANTAVANFSIVVGGGSGAQQMTISPASISFTVQTGSANVPADQTIGVNASAGALNYSVASSTSSGGNWLAIKSAASGSTPGSVVVSVANYSGLPAGTYNGLITITSAAANSPVIVPVTLSVLATPALVVSPGSFSVSQAATSGSNITRQEILLTNGGGTLHFTAAATTSKGSWLSVSAAEGNTPARIFAIIESGGLAPGTYSGSILITPAAGTPLTIAITLNVLPPAILVATPAPLSFVYQQGSAPPASQTVAVSSIGGSLNIAAFASTQSGGNWLSVDPPGAVTAANLTIAVNPAGLQPGTYTGTVNITPSNLAVAALSIPITLIVRQAPPNLTAVVNAASFAPGPVAPGEIVTLFGSAIGPSTLVGLHLTDAGNVDTAVSDTQVFFDGYLAPILYTSAGQVSVVVPYEVAGNASTNVQLQYLGARSNVLSFRVTDSAPGIFMVDMSGQGAILNQDFSINSAQNGAAPGSIVSIYATGEGQTDPVGLDGIITGSLLRRPRLNVSVQIGGQNADVLYAGAAPGQLAGLLQVNARVPLGVPRGVAVPVSIAIGSASSQAGVTVAIKP